MNEYKAPSPEDLNRYIVLIRFLREVHSNMLYINEEMEKFNSQLDKLGEVLEEHQWGVSDLQSSLLDYENDLKRVKSISPSEEHNNQSPGNLASITAGRELSKAEG